MVYLPGNEAALGNSEPKEGVHGFQFSKYEIAEFLTETERKKRKNTQWMLSTF